MNNIKEMLHWTSWLTLVGPNVYYSQGCVIAYEAARCHVLIPSQTDFWKQYIEYAYNTLDKGKEFKHLLKRDNRLEFSFDRLGLRNFPELFDSFDDTIKIQKVKNRKNMVAIKDDQCTLVIKSRSIKYNKQQYKPITLQTKYLMEALAMPGYDGVTTIEISGLDKPVIIQSKNCLALIMGYVK
jgi:hypothetical protein